MNPEVAQLTENDVVDAVCTLLARTRWHIEQRLTTADRGVDVIAARGDTTLHVEAKGATSSKTGTARHGRPFSNAQVTSHVARAFYRAAAEAQTAPGIQGAVALPDTPLHRAAVERIDEALCRLEIRVFWVDGDGARSVAQGERDILPSADVETSAKDRRLQRGHPFEDAQLAYGVEIQRAEAEALAAGSRSEDLTWIYFRSPSWTWENLCGREGWVLLDSGSSRQRAFIETVIN